MLTATLASEAANPRDTNRQIISFGRCLCCLHEHASPGVASQCQDFIDAVGGLTDSTHKASIDSPSTLFADDNDSRTPSPPVNAPAANTFYDLPSTLFDYGDNSRSPSPPPNAPVSKISTFDGLKEGKVYEVDLNQAFHATLDASLLYNIPLPRELQLLAANVVSMSPIELELMLFINNNFLPPSMYDSLMSWVCVNPGMSSTPLVIAHFKKG